MNQLMATLLTRTKVDLSDFDQLAAPRETIVLTTVGDSVLLEEELAHSKHVSLKDFEDRIGYECFVNHVHLTCRSGKRSLLAALGYIANLKRSLEEFRPNRAFVIIASFSDGECTVRFHESRQNEKWLADDIEGYKLEKILEIRTGDVSGSDQPL
jgi:hypothetical protein